MIPALLQFWVGGSNLYRSKPSQSRHHLSHPAAMQLSAMMMQMLLGMALAAMTYAQDCDSLCDDACKKEKGARVCF